MQGFIKTLFQSEISINQIKKIEKNLIGKLSEYDENFGIINEKRISEISNIYFSFNPKGISLMRELKNQNSYNQLQKFSRQIFNINGIEFYNIKSKLFQNIPCSFSHYQLKFIEFESPEKFYKTFDINNIRLCNLSIEKVNIVNPDKEIVEKILNINDNQIKILDLESCFEIEFLNNKYYTIVDFENGNYIAVNTKGQIFYLNHVSDIKINKIFENISEFLENYDVSKIELEERFL